MNGIAVLHYRTVEGPFPYREWVESIADKKARAVVLARVDRLAFGAFGDWKDYETRTKESPSGRSAR
jgi:putative component of toxin-antitoxin plasmid stabilization module